MADDQKANLRAALLTALELNKKQAKALNEQLSKDKKTRVEASHAVMLLVKKEDRSKIGFIQSEIYPALELSILIKNNKETVHFAYPYTPELYLVGIKYNPRYSTKTKGICQKKQSNTTLKTNEQKGGRRDGLC